MAILGWARHVALWPIGRAGYAALDDMGNVARAPWISSCRRYRFLPRLLMLRWSAAGGELTWTRPNHAAKSRPCSKVSPCRSPRSTPRRLSGPSPGWTQIDERPRPFVQRMNSVSKCDPSIESGPLGARLGDPRDHPRAQSRPALLIHQHGQELLEVSAAALGGHNDSALQKDRAQLID